MAKKDELGRRGEDLAAVYLEAQGLTVVERNWRCAQGEIDLVVFDEIEDEWVFVEVKTRSGVRYGHPLEAVTREKLARLRRLALAWCAEHPGSHNRARIDVVAIIAPRTGVVEIEHLERVF